MFQTIGTVVTSHESPSVSIDNTPDLVETAINSSRDTAVSFDPVVLSCFKKLVIA